MQSIWIRLDGVPNACNTETWDMEKDFNLEGRPSVQIANCMQVRAT